MSEDQFYQAIMQSAVDPMVVIDEQGMIVDLNQATVDTFQYERPELIGRNIAMLMEAHIANLHDQYIQRFLETGIRKIIGRGQEVVAIRKDGSRIHCYLAVSDLEVNGRTYFTGILRNIQAEKEAREQLAFNYQALSLLNEWVIKDQSETSAKITSFLEVLNRITAANVVLFVPDTPDIKMQESFYTFTDQVNVRHREHIHHLIVSEYRNILTHSELKGEKTIADAFPALTFPLRRLVILPVYSNHTWLGNLLLAWTPEAQDKHFDDRRDVLKTCLNSFGEYLDLQLTVRKLATINDRFHRSQIAANIGTWDWNIITGDIYWSDQIAPLFGYPHGELQTSYENFMAAVHPDDRERVQRAVNDCIDHNKRYDIDHRVVWPDGTVHWVNEKGNVTRDKNGKAVKMLGVVQDINRAKRAEESLLNATLKAEQANRAKTEFLSLISHELRTPLNSILGFSQLLSLQNLEENQALYTEQILEGGKVLIKLVNDIIDFSRIESNRFELEVEDIDLHKLAQQCLQMLAETARKNRVRLEHICNGNHPLVKGDTVRLKQILLNLMSNAIKYNKPGGVVEVNCEVLSNQMLRMTVKDTGHGIDPARHQEVFEPFSRLDFKNSAIEGAGIGLMITKKLIESMGGAIDFISEPGSGSTFWVDIPTTEVKASAGQATKTPSSTEQTGNWRILYIEDNPSNIALMKSVVLQHPQYELYQAVTAREGLEIARKQKPDVILMDINLPDFDGIKACERLKSDTSTRQIPVIALTADVARQSDNLVGNTDFFRVIYKPFDIDELLQALSAATECYCVN